MLSAYPEGEHTMRHVKLLLIIYLSVWTIVLGLAALSGYAMLLPSTDGSMQRQSDLSRIQAQLETKLVSEKLHAVGLTQQEAQVRLQNLSDDQIHDLAVNLDGLQVGGAVDWVLIAIIAGGVLLVMFVLSMITGTTDSAAHAVAGDHHHH
jgi:hypothetical protein